MSGPRIPHSYKAFRNGVFYCEFPSMKVLSEYMVENYFPHLKVDTMCKYVSFYPIGGSKSYKGFTFEGDPSWVSSKATKAINDDTGEVIITDSRGKMARRFYGTKDSCGTVKIVRLIKSGKKYKGFRFEDISVGYVDCGPNLNNDPVPIIGTHLRTCDVILCLSMTDAAKYVINTRRLDNTYIDTVTHNIKKAASRYMGRSSNFYGYRWTYPE